MNDLADFLIPINIHELNQDDGFNDGQLAKHIDTYHSDIPDVKLADIVLLGVGEYRGSGKFNQGLDAANIIRKNLYELNYWHKEVKIADIGNVECGANINDSYAAIKTLLVELLQLNKTVILLGGSHDVTLAQYLAYKEMGKMVEATCIDAYIDLKGESALRSENFLLELLTSEPNFVKHYNHIGFQSYFVHPRMIETMDRLHFDCYRVGKVKENIEEMEPVIRNTHLLSLDINAIKYSDAPSSKCSPNGFSGEDICALSRYAGMSSAVSSFGIYGYDANDDVEELTAKQIAQMIWYFIDGKNRSKEEAPLENRSSFLEFHVTFSELETLFLQSKKTGRWWMQLPNKKFIACSKEDYNMAANNEIPERWFRALERNA